MLIDHGLYTICGQRVDIANIRADQIRVWDVAWALHLINRYGGHTPTAYDVLSHTALVYSLYRQEQTPDTQFSLVLLLHDAAEAYLGDMLHPTKHLQELSGYVSLEESVAQVVYKRFGIAVADVDWNMVKRYDQQAAYIEFINLLPRATELAATAKQYEMCEYPSEVFLCEPLDYVNKVNELSVAYGVADIPALFEPPAILGAYVKYRQSWTIGAGASR
jgi:uncharacterized protein